jgi:hypothetical protein
LTLEHPYAQKKTVQELLVAQAHEPIPFGRVLALGAKEGIKAEYVWFLVEALEKDPARRFPNVAAMEERLGRLLAGEIPVQCHVTFAKRSGQAILHWIDRHPWLYTALFVTMLLATLVGLLALVVRLVAG